MIIFSVCLPSDALSQHLPSYLGFYYPGRGVCSSKAQSLLHTLDEGYLLTATPPDLEHGGAPLSPPVPAQPQLLGHCTGDRDQDHPHGKEMLKSKMAVWGGLTNICEKKRREKERYKHLNAEFQRIAGRDKKAFLSNQCKEIEENNRMGKTRDLFKKIRNTKGRFHAKMGLIKDRNGMDLTEAEDIKKWQEYTEELYKKDLHDQDNHDGVITHLEPDILECEVK